MFDIFVRKLRRLLVMSVLALAGARLAALALMR